MGVVSDRSSPRGVIAGVTVSTRGPLSHEYCGKVLGQVFSTPVTSCVTSLVMGVRRVHHVSRSSRTTLAYNAQGWDRGSSHESK